MLLLAGKGEKMSGKVLAVLAGVAVTLAMGAQVRAQGDVVFQNGFENESLLSGWPNAFGQWGGDVASIVSAENAISPREGTEMLKFRATGWSGSDGLGCEVEQIVDLSAFAADIAAGNATATWSAYFNRVPGDAQTDTRMVARIYAYAGPPEGHRTRRGNMDFLGRVYGEVFLDGDVNTWEPASVEWLLPPGTDYLSVEVMAVENIHDDTSSPEFDGHYADDVLLTVTPEPATLSLVALGALGLLRRRRR